ncbi:sulfate/molybdate ABC transporter ATP-binding protein [Xanthomonas sp. NCPPB 2654]|uniref:sulfate/molybdate ABC transporter ATP-binding protein n=1 Tax=unclassified Xanthomonas TaxID=2643310 RepID=UPI0021E092CE|nr:MULTISPECIES: sulfate/molybdate ABC transporter ATP-binding protein [unclassified Xanthomonas]MDL5367650.1 sulfate/molybdate ABC transporter ATP-binding protein [Xanthomonas sp. NCPPB 2654]UYC21799.1 sulfate/molybdate ABC transporter ATP-binding protein [Xanthomonas sp. CFBP 8443]
MTIRVQQLGKRFDAFVALDDVSLDIRQGELLALLGPSGSGKTTLLRVIAGLEHADAGRVLIDGEDATGLPVQSRRVGFVFQHYALFRHMTVRDNIAFGLRVRRGAGRLAEAAIRARVTELLALVQLDGLESRYPTQLSGGQRQRVALARALAIEPRVLLLDEPFGALDAQVRRDLRRWLRELHDRTGLTTVFVTHDQEEALELADRVAILNRGRIEQLGSPADVYDRPVSPFVYGFVGAVNRLPAQLRDGQLQVAGLALPAPDTPLSSGPVDLYVRPEDLAPGDSGWTATVLSSQRSGSRLRLRAQLTHGQDEVEVELPAGEGTARYAPGQVLQLSARRFGLFAQRS